MKKTKLFPRTPLEGIILSSEETTKMQQKLREAIQRREDRVKEINRRKHMAIEVKAGSCACGGILLYNSSFKFVATGPMVFGGTQSGYHQEIIKCNCFGCGLLYDHTHMRFQDTRNKVSELRIPPPENREGQAP